MIDMKIVCLSVCLLMAYLGRWEPGVASQPPTESSAKETIGTTIALKAQVVLYFHNRDSVHQPFCSGSLVTGAHVLTTARCCRHGGLEDRPIFVGKGKGSNEKLIEVQRKQVHPRFSPTAIPSHDVCLLFLSKRVATSRMAKLPVLHHSDSDWVVMGSMATWDSIALSAKKPTGRPSVRSYPVIRHVSQHAGLGAIQAFTDFVESPCMGDRGAPLIDAEGALRGILKDTDCDGELLFIDVYEYTDWIRKEVWPSAGDDHLPWLDADFRRSGQNSAPPSTCWNSGEKLQQLMTSYALFVLTIWLDFAIVIVVVALARSECWCNYFKQERKRTRRQYKCKRV